MKIHYYLNYLLAVILSVFLFSCSDKKVSSTENVAIFAFDVAGVSTPEQGKELDKMIRSMKGVTACSVNPSSKIAAVTFYSPTLNPEKIALEVNNSSEYKLSSHMFKKVSGGCPIHKAEWWLSWLPWMD